MCFPQYSSTLATSCEELTHWKRLWCWEGLGAGGEGNDRGWDGWMASLTRWMWVWVNSGRWWWTGRPGVLRYMGRKESDMTEQLNWTEDCIVDIAKNYCCVYSPCIWICLFSLSRDCWCWTFTFTSSLWCYFFCFLSPKLIKVSFGLLLFISFGSISSSRITGLVGTCGSVLSDWCF